MSMVYDRTDPNCVICKLLQHREFKNTCNALYCDIQNLLNDIPRTWINQESSQQTAITIKDTINDKSANDKTFGEFFPNANVTLDNVYKHAMEHSIGLFGEIWHSIIELDKLKKSIPIHTTTENQDGDGEVITEESVSTEALKQRKLIDDEYTKRLAIAKSLFKK